jgi:hypothetical protein
VPIARYFIFVGSTLAALLFIPGWLLPMPLAMFGHQSVALDRAVIRIESAHKGPEKVILDATQLTVKPPVTMDPPAIQPSIQPPPGKARDQSNLEAMALFKPNTQPTAINHSALKIKRRAARNDRSRRVARGPVTHGRREMGGGCCRFGWVDSGQSSLNATPPGRAASSWSLD